MARASKRPAPAKQPATPEPRKMLLSIRGYPAWKEWLDRLAKENRTTSTELIDQALRWYAKEKLDFKEPPPER